MLFDFPQKNPLFCFKEMHWSLWSSNTNFAQENYKNSLFFTYFCKILAHTTCWNFSASNIDKLGLFFHFVGITKERKGRGRERRKNDLNIFHNIIAKCMIVKPCFIGGYWWINLGHLLSHLILLKQIITMQKSKLMHIWVMWNLCNFRHYFLRVHHMIKTIIPLPHKWRWF